MQSTVAKRMRTGPPFSFRRENGGSKKMFSEPGNTPYRQIAPSKKASSAGWIAKRKASNTDDANKPYPFSFMRIYNCKCPAPAPRDTVHMHTPFARHKDARTSSAAAPPPLQGIKKDRTHPAFFLFDTIPHQVRLFLFGSLLLDGDFAETGLVFAEKAPEEE